MAVKIFKKTKRRFIIGNHHSFGGKTKYVLIENNHYKCVNSENKVTHDIDFNEKTKIMVNQSLKNGAWKEIPECEAILL